MPFAPGADESRLEQRDHVELRALEHRVVHQQHPGNRRGDVAQVGEPLLRVLDQVEAVVMEQRKKGSTADEVKIAVRKALRGEEKDPE